MPSLVSLVGSLYVKTDSTVVAGTGADTSLMGSGVGSITLPANFFGTGKTLRVRASGVYGTAGGPNSALNLFLRLGGIGGTVVLDTGSHTPSAGQSGALWKMEGDVACRAAGVSGAVMAQGRDELWDSPLSASMTRDMQNVSTIAIDTTAAMDVVLSAQWSGGGSASDAITCTNLTLESLG